MTLPMLLVTRSAPAVGEGLHKFVTARELGAPGAGGCLGGCLSLWVVKTRRQRHREVK